MRLIGHLNSEKEARAFGDFLYARGIDSGVEAERDGRWAVWVHAEDQLSPAAQLLTEYRANPGDSRYAEAVAAAARRRTAEERADDDARKRFFTRERIFPQGLRAVGVVTLALILLSVGVGILSRGALSEQGMNPRVVQALTITQYRTMGPYLAWEPGLSEVRQGQVWRLVTPIFLHFGPLHLLFNMMWMLDLGTMIERRRGGLFLAGLVLVIAIASNLAQAALKGPAFGGMSGVVYGLIGYIWMKGRFDPDSGLYLHPTTVTMAVIWFFLCLAGIIPNAANVVHAVGFGVGLAWGFLSAMVANRGGRRAG
jgi:GlpG protein